MERGDQGEDQGGQLVRILSNYFANLIAVDFVKLIRIFCPLNQNIAFNNDQHLDEHFCREKFKADLKKIGDPCKM